MIAFKKQPSDFEFFPIRIYIFPLTFAHLQMVIQRMWTAGEPEARDLRVPRQSDCESIKLRKNIIIQLLIGAHMF